MPNQVAFSDNTALARNKTPPLRITKRIREAIDTMVERGLDMQQAGAEAGLTTRHMRLQLSKPHVAAYYREQCQVFRASTAARNIHRLCEIRDAENNMPAVNAIKTLMGVDDEQTNNKQTTSPGVTIRIVQMNTAPMVHAQTEITAKADDIGTTDNSPRDQ